MRPGFQRYPAARHGTENFAQRFRTRTHSLLQLDLPRFIQYAVPTVAIPQIQSDRQCWLRKLFALLAHSGANLIHCRSPLSLVPLSTSITWERTASRRRPVFSSHLITRDTVSELADYRSSIVK